MAQKTSPEDLVDRLLAKRAAEHKLNEDRRRSLYLPILMMAPA